MKTMRLEYPVAALCRAFGFSRSGYYAWNSGALSPRAQADERLKVAIKAVHAQSRETYGPLRMQPELAVQGFEAGRDRIARLRRELALRCRQKRLVVFSVLHYARLGQGHVKEHPYHVADRRVHRLMKLPLRLSLESSKTPLNHSPTVVLPRSVSPSSETYPL